MKWRTKWVLAIVLTVSVIGVSKLENAGVIKQSLTQYVTTGDDFVAVKKWVASFKKDSDKVMVSADASKLNPYASYQSIQPYKDGVIVAYPQAMEIEAQGNGMILFTGFTRESGKTVTVLYDNGDEVTYGFVGTFSKLPYTTVKRGDTLALMDEEAIYLMVKRDGVKMDASLIPTYLSGDEQ